MAIKKCTICGEDSKALHMHMKKHVAKIKHDPFPQQFNRVADPTAVSKEEFEAYKKESSAKLDKMLTLLQEAKSEPEPQVVSESKVPHTHEEMFAKYFDREDGFNCEVDTLENTFSIIVPPKFSNASPAHKDFYKVDKRMIKMDANNPLGTVEEWCVRVSKNLRYDKAVKTK